MYTALSIAGTDPSRGAGMQADLKAMTMHGVFATSAITALVAQNTMGVREIVEVSPDFLGSQMDCVFEDIPPQAVKIGMVATSGDRLISEEAVDTLEKLLLPLAKVVTPNIPEAEILSGMTITTPEDIEQAAKLISKTYGCSVLLKGGHNINDANDYLYENGKGTWFMGKRIDNPNTHGTGCTLSSAIAANLAKGFDLSESIKRSKDYLSGALGAMLDLGKGRGPMKHNFDLTGEYAKEAVPSQK